MKIKFAHSIIVAAIGLAATQSSFAIDGTIDFSGEITANTCTVKVGDTNVVAGKVTLPTVSASALPATGSVAGSTSFNIQLTDCSITKDTTVHTYFEQGAYTTSTGRLAQSDTSGAQNVELQLLNSQLGVIDAAAGKDNQNDVGAPIKVGDTFALLTYYVQYYATGTVTAGAVTSQVNYSIIYD